MTGPVLAVDSHAHALRMDAPLAASRHSVPEREASAADFLAVLDAHGISHGVLTAPSFYGSDNTVLLEALAYAPERLRGSVIVDPGVDDATLAAFDAAGVVGVRLNWSQRGVIPDVSRSEWQRLFAHVRALDWHVELFIEGERMPDVVPAIAKSGVKLVLDHFACPEPRTGVSGAAFRLVLDQIRAGRTWVKLSAPYRLRGADPRVYFDAFLAAGGGDCMMWASDWPWVSHAAGMTYRQCVAWFDEWVSDATLRRKILIDTPGDLFRFR